jgi:hypothetical protein
MLWTLYFVVATSTATASFSWRNLLLDHPAFEQKVRRIPYVGKALSCSFCFTVWLTLPVTLLLNPLAEFGFGVSNDLSIFLIRTLFGWLSTAAGVLLIRFSLACLMEGAVILLHRHRALHEVNVEQKL